MIYNLVSLIAVLAVLFQLKPSVLNPVLWTEPNPLPTLTGPLTQNTLLTHVRKVGHDFSGPESIVFDPVTGHGYASVSDGSVIRLSQDGVFEERVFFTGGYLASGKQGNGVSDATLAFFKHCNTEALTHRLAWNTTAERQCGRPLGMRIYLDSETSQRTLYILDAYHGLFALHLGPDSTSSQVEHLVTPQSTIQVYGLDNYNGIDEIVFKTPIFFNDLDILSNGDIIYSDSSYRYSRSENRQELLDGAGRGRLFYYQKDSKVVYTLICGLHFPNGVQRLASSTDDKKKDSVIVSDLTRFRILSVNLQNLPTSPLHSGDNQSFTAKDWLESCSEYGSLYQQLKKKSSSREGIVKIFADSNPGLVDNLRRDSYDTKKNIYLGGLGSKSTKPFSLLWIGLQSNLLRDIIGKFVSMKFVEKLVPRYGLVVAYNDNGEIVSSLHDPTGKEIAFISHAERHPITGDLWLGSHSEAYIGILPKEYINW